MIERLKYKNSIDVYDFVKNVNDKYQDFYVTHENQRLFLTEFNLIKKILVRQEVFGYFDKGLHGLLIIYKEKGFRPYVKILSENRHAESFLIKFLMFNFSEQDLYIKLKKDNTLAKYMRYFGFIPTGDRGQEILLFRKGIKILHKMRPKDLFLGDENRLY